MTMTTGDQAASSPDQISDLATSWFNEEQKGGAYGWMDMIRNFETVGEG